MDQVEIILEGEAVVLRPTLEAAMLVDNRFGGYSAAFQSVLSHSLDGTVAIVAAGAGRSVGKALREKVYKTGIRNLVAPLSQYLTLLLNGGRTPADEEGGDESQGTITHAEHHQFLLRAGMGLLGWTEQETLNTTMSSIIAAHRHRIDLLKSLFGTSKSDRSNAAGKLKPATPANVLAVFRRLG